MLSGVEACVTTKILLLSYLYSAQYDLNNVEAKFLKKNRFKAYLKTFIYGFFNVVKFSLFSPFRAWLVAFLKPRVFATTSVTLSLIKV